MTLSHDFPPLVGAELSIGLRLYGSTNGRSSCAMRIAITVGPAALRAAPKAFLISSFVLVITPAQPKPLAADTMSRPGRSRPGTFGVFSNFANSLRMAYSSLHGTMNTALSLCCAAEYKH